MENTEENPLIINENEKLVESSDPFDDGSESKVSEEGIKSPVNGVLFFYLNVFFLRNFIHAPFYTFLYET